MISSTEATKKTVSPLWLLLKRRSGALELLAWVTALIVPVFINPYANDHFTVCIFRLLGVEWCPGCGLGRSIALFYRGEWMQSLQAHWLGIAAVGIISARIIALLKLQFNKTTKLSYYAK
jgi:hypothetical protein